MDIELRISAGAIVINQGKMLLVRNKDGDGPSYLLAPGGGVLSDESVNEGAVREVREETGLEVIPRKILLVEDMLWLNRRILKTWFLCDLISGQLMRTGGAVEEGIIEAGWYRRDQLENETVYPAIVKCCSWESFFKDTWEVKYLDSRKAV